MEKALEVVKCLDKYFLPPYHDLEVFAAHAGPRDCEVRGLGAADATAELVTGQVSLHVLVE